MFRIWLRARQAAVNLIIDCRGIAATEFAMIVPAMLVMFFGVVEISNGVATDRKVTLIARTLTDLTGQAIPDQTTQISATIDDNYLQNVFTASIAIMKPYTPTPTKAQISEIYIDSTQKATVQWSRAATVAAGATQATLTNSTRSPGDTVTGILPAALLKAKQTYVIFSEVSYLYVPTLGFVMGKAGVTLNDVSYTRPRQVVCVIYNSAAGLLPDPNTPTPNTPCATP
jgi:Flp pilus assembly protein TadG